MAAGDSVNITFSNLTDLFKKVMSEPRPLPGHLVMQQQDEKHRSCLLISKLSLQQGTMCVQYSITVFSNMQVVLESFGQRLNTKVYRHLIKNYNKKLRNMGELLDLVKILQRKQLDANHHIDKAVSTLRVAQQLTQPLKDDDLYDFIQEKTISGKSNTVLKVCREQLELCTAETSERAYSQQLMGTSATMKAYSTPAHEELRKFLLLPSDSDISEAVDNIDMVLQCDECDFQCRQKYGLQVHKASKHTLTVYKCKLCKFKATSDASLILHVDVVHGKNAPVYYCNQCDYSTTRRTSLVIHSNGKHMQQSFKCDKCDYQTSWRHNLKQHFYSRHSLNKVLYNCDQCDAKFSLKGNLTKHIQKRHFC